MPPFVVYFETACFFGVFFVALPIAAAARSGNSGIGISASFEMNALVRVLTVPSVTLQHKRDFPIQEG